MPVSGDLSAGEGLQALPTALPARTRDLFLTGLHGVPLAGSHSVVPAPLLQIPQQPSVAFLFEDDEADHFVLYTQQAGAVRQRSLSNNLPTVVTSMHFDPATRVLADQAGFCFTVLHHQMPLLQDLACMLQSSAVPHNIPHSDASCPTLLPGDEVEVAADATKVSCIAPLFPAATQWHPRMCNLCGELARVVSVDPGQRTVTLEHSDASQVTWPLAVCKVVVDTVLEDACSTVESLRLGNTGVLKGLLFEGRGNKRLTLDSLRAIVRALDDAEGAPAENLTWHDRQRLIEATARLQSQRRINSPTSRAFQLPPPYMYVVLHALMRTEREHDRLVQAPLLMQAMEKCGESALPSSYYHHLLAVVGCTPALWERSAHWSAAKEASLRLDIRALLDADFSPEEATTARMVRPLEEAMPPLLKCQWVLRKGEHTRRIPAELRWHISEYLLPVSTLGALQSRLEQVHQPQDEDEGLELGIDIYQQAIERVTTVHDRSIMEGCVALMGRDFGAAKGHFARAMQCHRNDAAPPAATTQKNAYVAMLFSTDAASPTRCCSEECCAACEAPLPPSVQLSPPFLDQFLEDGQSEALHFSPSPESDDSLAYSPSQWMSATGLSASGSAESAPDSARHSPPQSCSPPPHPECYDVEECACGVDTTGPPQLLYANLLRSVAEQPTRQCGWTDEVQEAHQLVEEDDAFDCNCCFCLYHMALCVDIHSGIRLLEKAEALYQAEHHVTRGRQGSTCGALRSSNHSTPNYSNSCDFTSSMVNLLLGLYYVAAGEHLREGNLEKVAGPFKVAHSMTGSTLAAAWLAKLELLQTGGRQRGRMLLSSELYKMWNAPSEGANAPSLFYSDFARLAEARATIYCSIDDINLALAKSPKRPVLHQLKAAMLSDMGQTEAAIESLTTSIGYTYQAADLLHRARLRLKLGHVAEAVDDLSACLLFQPSNPKAKRLLARYSEHVKRDTSALLHHFYSRTGYVSKAACLYQWVTVQPHNPHVYCRISQFFFRLGSKRSVHDFWCTRALNACDEKWRSLFQGLLAESYREYELAAELFREAVRKMPLEYECHLMLAYTLVSLKRYEESTRVLQCAVHLAMHPSQCSIIYNNIGFNYRCTKMYNTALGYFDKSKEFIPHLHYTFFNPFSNASEIYFMMGEQQRAVEEIHAGLKMAIEVRPSMLEELLTKGKFKSVDEFFTLCQQIKALDPYNEFTYRFGAAVMCDTGMMDASLEELDEGIELTLGTQALVMRGEILHHFRLKKAQDYLAMALLLDPHNEAALRLFHRCGDPSTTAGGVL